MSALLIGTFAPDLEYFLRLQPGGGWGHTLPGAFGMSLPLGLAALWIFHRFVKVPLVYLLPDAVRARLTRQLVPFHFGPLRRFLLIVFSMLIGIATHLAWDGFTHEQYWGVRHVPALSLPVHVPVLGWMPWCQVLQFVSSVAGLGIVALWCLLWYRRATPDTRYASNPFTAAHRLVIALMGTAAAILGAGARAWIGVGLPTNHYELGDFINQMIVTFGALIWWQLAMWGLFGPFRHARPVRDNKAAYPQSQT